jgi:hypothetical protein
MVAIVTVSVGDFGSRVRISTRQALLGAGIALLVGFTVLLIIHLTWDAVGSPYIDLQGRYFIPIGPLMGFALSRWGGALPSTLGRVMPFIGRAAIASIPCLLLMSTLSIHARYFVDSNQSAAERCFRRATSLLPKGNATDEACSVLAEGLRLAPENAPMQFLLGWLLAKRGSSEAREHLRAAVRLEPKNVEGLRTVGNLILDDGDYEEAIQLFQDAQRIDPKNNIVRGELQIAQSRKELLNFVSQTLLSRAQADMLERRHQGTERDGWYVKPNQGKVLGVQGLPPALNVAFVWRSPPPSGEEVRLLALDSRIPTESRLPPFYACAADQAGGNRIFVFPAPLNTVLLADERVSWYFQKRLIDLTPAEREQEQEYRAKRELRFPLPALSEE